VLILLRSGCGSSNLPHARKASYLRGALKVRYDSLVGGESLEKWGAHSCQLRILNRGRKRAPNLSAGERFIAGLCTLLMNQARVLRSAIVLKPSTLLHLHHVLAKRKYRILFSRNRRRPPGPKGPNKKLIDAVVELKRRNLNWGCPRIAQQITVAFGVAIDKDVVRRILSVHYRPEWAVATAERRMMYDRVSLLVS